MTKREWAHKIAEKLDALHNDLHSEKITPVQHSVALRELYSDMQRESGYADGAFAQVWQAGCKEHNLRTFGITPKTQF